MHALVSGQPSALGALSGHGAQSSAPAGTSPSDAAAQEFAAFLGAAIQQASTTAPVHETQRVALAALADATWGGEGEEPATGATLTEPMPETGDVKHLLAAFDGSDETSRTSTRATSEEEALANDELRAERTTRRGARSTARSTRVSSTAVADRGTSNLDPEFAARLQRVIDRMQEAGHDVELVETTRSGARQDALYAQGRTTAGPVVTWTRDSRHEHGAAADLRVDGASSGKGYATLQRIANEEGLRTLGARDPGHVELPRTTVDATDGATARRGSAGVMRFMNDLVAGMPGMRGVGAPVARVAQVATVAPVANVARIAQVATVATPIASGSILMQSGLTNGSMNGLRSPAAGANSSTRSTAAAARATAAGAATLAAAATGAVALSAPTLGATATGSTATKPATRNQGAPAAGKAAAHSAVAQRFAETAPVLIDATAPTGDEQPILLDGTANEERRGSGRVASEVPADATRTVDMVDARATRAERVRRNVERAAQLVDDARSGAMEQVQGESRDRLTGMGETMRAAAPRSGGLGSTVAPAGSLAAERVAELLAARDAAPAPTIGELRLAMDPMRDGLSEVRLALQGNSLEATLRTADPGIARGLQGEIASLARTLEKQGFESARVQVALDAVQQQRTIQMETVTATGQTAADRAVRGDDRTSDQGRDGRQQHGAADSQRDQQHAQRFGGRRGRGF